jgi:RNA polymerase sigma-70 factor (ECF subfamily)
MSIDLQNHTLTAGHQPDESGHVRCLVAPGFAPRLERTLSRWARDHCVEVIVDARRAERRHLDERRSFDWPARRVGDVEEHRPERRRIRNRSGRRIGERRGTLVPVSPPAPLPRRLGTEAARVVFVERLSPTAEQLEDADTARLITRLQSGQTDLLSDLYVRYFDRVYSYLRVTLRDCHEAEDGAQQVFVQVMQALARYEIRDVPFRAWLFRIVRNYAVRQLQKQARTVVEDPLGLDRRREVEPGELEPSAVGWLSDGELVILVSSLPAAQRQVLMLRYMMDLSWAQIADILGRSPAAVRQLQARALTQLRARLGDTERGVEAAARMHATQRPRPLPVLQARSSALLHA